MNPVRVLTANIQSGRSASGKRTTEAELAAAFAGIRTDVAALQEVDRRQPRSGRIDQLPIIADALGLEHYRFAAALAGDVRWRRSAARPIGQHPGPAYGVALASRYPIIAWFATRLPQAIRRLPMWSEGRPRWWVHEPRVALAAVLDTPGGRIAVGNTHLSLLPMVARQQLRTVLANTADLAGRAIVAGDFNLPAGTVGYVAPDWHMPRALTFPADFPARQIDHILVRGGTAHHPRAHRLPISDHRAMSAEVYWI
ncbi:MAG TPA: endonuclease/exonuclease/phosphatase family protein [Beutenbergiaceae bacterium]|nr:endonuclease/exonuclease/phosphatase family protein [Beutenbergiaceae bacterium]